MPVVHLGDALRFNLPYGRVKAIKLGNILCCNYYNFTLLLTQIGRYYSSVHLYSELEVFAYKDLPFV